MTLVKEIRAIMNAKHIFSIKNVDILLLKYFDN